MVVYEVNENGCPAGLRTSHCLYITTLSVAVFKCGSKVFGTAPIKRWSLWPLLLNLGGLRTLGPIEPDQSATMGFPRLKQKRPRCFHLGILTVGDARHCKEVREPKMASWEVQM